MTDVKWILCVGAVSASTHSRKYRHTDTQTHTHAYTHVRDYIRLEKVEGYHQRSFKVSLVNNPLRWRGKYFLYVNDKQCWHAKLNSFCAKHTSDTISKMKSECERWTNQEKINWTNKIIEFTVRPGPFCSTTHKPTTHYHYYSTTASSYPFRVKLNPKSK